MYTKRIIYFIVKGDPLPKQSFSYSRITAGETRGRFRGFTPQKLKNWQELIHWKGIQEMQGSPPSKNDFIVIINFFLPTKRRKDLDNLSKAVLDGLNGVVWEDDKQVIDIHLRKYHLKTHPGFYIALYEKDTSYGFYEEDPEVFETWLAFYEQEEG